MLILAVDTSTLTGSVAIVDAEGGVRAEVGGDPRAPSDRVVGLCAEAVAAAGIAMTELDAIAVGAGPGSFTGLRIGLATGKGLAYALGKPLWLASSLAALAYDHLPAVADGSLIVPALDARRGELYAGFYRRAGARLIAVGPELVVAPTGLAAAIAAYDQHAEIVGDAVTIYAAALAALPTTMVAVTGARATPSARGVAVAASHGDRGDHLAHGAPTYIRPSEAEVKYPDGVPGAWRRS